MNALARLQTRRSELAQQLEAARQFLAGFDAAVALINEEPPAPAKPPRQVNRRRALPAPRSTAAAAPKPAAEKPHGAKRGVIDRAEFERLWMANIAVSKIAERFGVTDSAIYMAKKNWGMPSRAGWPVGEKGESEAAA